MKFRRKSRPEPGEAAEAEEATGDAVTESDAPAPGLDDAVRPRDVSELDDLGQWVDMGSLLISPKPNRELRIQVDENTQQVQSVLIAGNDGAMELRPFSAPRNGNLWDEVRPQIAADMARRGGTADERPGPFGTELLCKAPVQAPDGRAGMQPSRIIGVNGPRWLLRVTLLGRPAMEPELAEEWEQLLSGVAVRRGEQAMPPGDALPLTLPDDARRSGPLPDQPL